MGHEPVVHEAPEQAGGLLGVALSGCSTGGIGSAGEPERMVVIRSGEGIAQPSVGAADDERAETLSAPGASPGLSTEQAPQIDQGICTFCGFPIELHKPLVVWESRQWHLKCAWAMLDE